MGGGEAAAPGPDHVRTTWRPAARDRGWTARPATPRSQQPAKAKGSVSPPASPLTPDLRPPYLKVYPRPPATSLCVYKQNPWRSPNPGSRTHARSERSLPHQAPNAHAPRTAGSGACALAARAGSRGREGPGRAAAEKSRMRWGPAARPDPGLTFPGLGPGQAARLLGARVLAREGGPNPPQLRSRPLSPGTPPRPCPPEALSARATAPSG